MKKKTLFKQMKEKMCWFDIIVMWAFIILIARPYVIALIQLQVTWNSLLSFTIDVVKYGVIFFIVLYLSISIREMADGYIR